MSTDKNKYFKKNSYIYIYIYNDKNIKIIQL